MGPAAHNLCMNLSTTGGAVATQLHQHPFVCAVCPPYYPPLPFLPTGLAPSAAAAMLAHSYSAVVPISPLPGAPLPLQLGQPGPTFYGPSSLSGSPWLHLALYAAAG